VASQVIERSAARERAAEIPMSRVMLREPSRMPELDGIRGIAIILTLLFHGFTLSMRNEIWTGLPHWVELATRPGWMGVDLFFVLSGFLITRILLGSVGKPHYFRNFYARRALRILPLYYLILILIGVSYKASGSYVAICAFYLANMAPIFGIPILYSPLWSLSVEEHFYLLWPWAISRLKPNRIWLLPAGILVIEPILRGIAFFHGWDFYSYSWFRFDGLAAGALLAFFVKSDRYSRERLYLVGLLCFGGGTIVDAAITPGGMTGEAFLFTASALFCSAVIAAVLSGKLRSLSNFMRTRWLTKCGELSYCLYIVHVLIFYGWDSILGKYPSPLVNQVGRFGTLCLRALAVYAISIVVAELSGRYFEGPLLRLKQFFPSSPATDLVR
jgi:peptidoglycan/LPS O-acetylase OafA/YrhL